MSELEDKINAVLGDPKQMEQITKLAKSFMGGGTPGKGVEPEPKPKGEEDLFASLGLDGEALQKMIRIMRRGGGEKGQGANLRPVLQLGLVIRSHWLDSPSWRWRRSAPLSILLAAGWPGPTG